MQYLSIKEAAEKWGISRRRVQLLCSQDRIEGTIRIGNTWAIPFDAFKPDDARLRTDINSQKFYNPENILIERAWAMPNKNTFGIKPIHNLISEEIDDKLWIDPFANTNKFAKITNDLNPKFDTTYHLDALDFLKLFENSSVDGVLYDPPFSPRQVSECYNNVGLNVTWDTTKASFWGNHKKEISRIVKVGGKVISFGWNSGGIGMKYGFTIKRILLVSHGGWHNDTICTVEVKTHNPENTVIEVHEDKQNKKENPVLDFNDQLLISTLKKLPENYWDFKNVDTREYTHGLHTYPAMMVSPISKNIIKIVSSFKKVEALFDPFCGSGTVLVEGMLAGIKNICGNDINPLALFLSKVKTKSLDISDMQREREKLLLSITTVYKNFKKIIETIDDDIVKLGYDLTSQKGWGEDAGSILSDYCYKKNISVNIPKFKNIGYWFKPKVIFELSVIKEEIKGITDLNIRDFMMLAFSETIRLVSNRRNGEFKLFRMPKEKVQTFSPDVFLEFSKILQRNIEKMALFVDELTSHKYCSEVKIYSNNACSLDDIPDNSFDLIITSPPYGDSRTTVAYGEFSRLSLQWLDLKDITETNIMKIDKSLMGGEKFRNGFEYSVHSSTLKNSLFKIKDLDLERAGDVFSFYKDLERSISEISKKTKKNGYQFWVVGNRTVKNENLRTDLILQEISEHYGLIPVFSVQRNISNKVMPSKNSPSNQSGNTNVTMCNEHIVILRKVI